MEFYSLSLCLLTLWSSIHRASVSSISWVPLIEPMSPNSLEFHSPNLCLLTLWSSSRWAPSPHCMKFHTLNLSFMTLWPKSSVSEPGFSYSSELQSSSTRIIGSWMRTKDTIIDKVHRSTNWLRRFRMWNRKCHLCLTDIYSNPYLPISCGSPKFTEGT